MGVREPRKPKPPELHGGAEAEFVYESDRDEAEARGYETACLDGR